ncbi:MAG: DUF92 domain-containing protein [Chloroflexi bacterium]|nr:DUF92 domain-containing protein [Chloroflexota bacterium]
MATSWIALSGHTPLGLWGWGAAAGIAWLAYWARALSPSGAWAAWVVGGVLLGWGGWAWGVVLLAFFVSSSALSRWAQARRHAGIEKFAKGSRRDAGQVLANGGWPTLVVIARALGWLDPAQAWLLGTAALAAANADTWATEIGVFHPRPRWLLVGRPVAPGTSGGMSSWGTLAAVLGAAWIAAWAVALAPMGAAWPLGLAVGTGGIVGAGVDSLLGATLQGMYYCPTCRKETEQHPIHRTCGTATQWRRGWRWMTNDVVNALAIASAMLWAWGMGHFLWSGSIANAALAALGGPCSRSTSPGPPRTQAGRLAGTPRGGSSHGEPRFRLRRLADR